MPLLPRLDGLPRAYWTLWAGSLVNRLGGFVVPFLALYLTREGGVTVEDAGFVMALYGGGSLGGALAGGALADRIGRRATLTFGLAAGAAAMLVLGFARGPTVLAGAVLALGFFGDLHRPAVHAAVTDLVPPEDRPRAMGFLYWGFNLGFAIAPVIAGFVAARSYRVLFIADAATTLAFAVIIAAGVPETHPSSRDQTPPRADPFAPLRDRVFAPFLACQLLVGLVFQQAFVALPITMRDHGIPPERFGALIAINGALIVLVQPFSVETLARFRRSRVLAAGALLTGLGFGMTAIVAGAAGYALSIAVWTAGEIVLTSVAMTVAADLAPIDRRGVYQGAFGLVWGTASLCAPVIGTFVLAHAGATVLWAGCLAAGVASTVGHALLSVDGPAGSRHDGREAAEQPGRLP